MTNNIDKIIEEATRHALNEHMGVSDNVLVAAEKVLNGLVNDFPKVEASKIEHPVILAHGYYSMQIVEYSKTLQLTFGNLQVNAELYLYDSTYESTYNDVYNTLSNEGLIRIDFEPYSNTITLNLPWPMNNKLTKDVKAKVMPYLNHELLHAYQHRMRGEYTQVSPQYTNSLKNLHGASNENSTLWLIEDRLPEIYYMLTTDEIYTHLQQMYVEAVSGKYERINDTPTSKRLYRIISDFDKIKLAYSETMNFHKNANTRSFIENYIRTKLECEPKEYFSHCESGVKILRNGMMRVYARWQQEGQGRDATGNQSSYIQANRKLRGQNRSGLRGFFNRFNKN